MTNTEIKNFVNVNIREKTTPKSITKESVSSALDEIVDYVDYSVEGIPQGPQGPQGVQGPAGPLGPVGPAGLTWRGTWVSGTSYVLNDAVGYNGASYFCISATNGTTNPSVTPLKWALLASQGAQGIQGVQGPTGAQGPAGISGSILYTEGTLNADIIGDVQYNLIESNFTRVYVSSDVNNFIGLSNIGVDTGNFFVIQNKSTTRSLIVVPLDNARFLQPNGFDAQVNFTLGPNRYARFTLADNTSGSDKVFMIEVINPLGSSAIQLPTVAGNYANDAAAATGGILVGGMYHTSGVVKIRLV